jgi:hypothetical protein
MALGDCFTGRRGNKKCLVKISDETVVKRVGGKLGTYMTRVGLNSPLGGPLLAGVISKRQRTVEATMKIISSANHRPGQTLSTESIIFYVG